MPIQVYVVAVLSLAMAVQAFRNPRHFLTPYFGVEASTVDSRSEIQAVYGGFGVAIAVLLMLPIWIPAAKTGVLIAVAGSLFGMAAGRIVAALREKPGRWPAIFFAIECALGATLLTAL